MKVFNQAGKYVSLITKYNDIAMVALLVIVIGLMIVPLPTPVMDTFIGINLALSFLMLMMSMYQLVLKTERAFLKSRKWCRLKRMFGAFSIQKKR
jgi:type III secretory pathway component EscV